jgi:cellobiose transport system substrate-binding protein
MDREKLLVFWNSIEESVAMKQTKRRIIVTSLFIFLCCTLVGCSVPQLLSGAQSSNNGKITLTLWYPKNSINDHLLAQVSKVFPNVRIRALKIGGSFDAKFRTALAGQSNIPDLVALNYNIATYFPDADQFVNLLTLGAGDIKNEYLSWKWDLATTPDGRLIALPMDIGPTVLFYRSDLFQQAGLPTDPSTVAARIDSWDAYIQAGQQLQTALHGKSYMFDDIDTVFGQILNQGSFEYFDRANNYIGNQSHVKRAWDYAAKVAHLGLSAKAVVGTTEWDAALNNGAVASFVGASWMESYLVQRAQATAGEWRITQAPGGAGNDGGSFLAITKACAHPQEAYEVIKWLLSPPNQAQTFLSNHLFPSTPASYNDPRVYRPDPFFGGQVAMKVFSQAAKQVKLSYLGPYSTTVEAVFQRELSLVETQNMDPEVAWNAAQQEIQRELSH